jgi:hypothetical protein
MSFSAVLGSAQPGSISVGNPGAVSVPSGAISLSAAAQLAAPGVRGAAGACALAASPSLSCSYLSARITLSANSMFPANGTGLYGPAGDSSTVVVPGVIDGVFDA